MVELAAGMFVAERYVIEFLLESIELFLLLLLLFKGILLGISYKVLFLQLLRLIFCHVIIEIGNRALNIIFF